MRTKKPNYIMQFSLPSGQAVEIKAEGLMSLLSVSSDSRDAIASASTFLVILRDVMDDMETKIRIDRVINHLSNMLYGFETKEVKPEKS